MVEIDDIPSQNLPASRTLRGKPSSRNNIREITYIICDKFTNNKIYDKHRLENEIRAENFLKTTKN